MASIIEIIAQELSDALKSNRARGFQASSDEEILEDSIDIAAEYFENAFSADSALCEEVATNLFSDPNLLKDVSQKTIMSAIVNSCSGALLDKPSTEIDSATIEAVKLLREQFREPDLSGIRKFQGVRKEGVSALEFYETHYAEVKGRMHGGLLSSHDRRLYNGLAAELHRDGRSVSDVLPSYESVLEERRAAAARLLDVDSAESDDVGKFFYSIRIT